MMQRFAMPYWKDRHMLLNTGHMGGMQTMALLHDGIDQKLEPADKTISAWLRYYDLRRRPAQPYRRLVRKALRRGSGKASKDDTAGDSPARQAIASRERLGRGFMHLFLSLNAIDAGTAMGDLAEDEVLRLEPTKEELALWAKQRYAMSHSLDGQALDERLEELDTLFRYTIPLEFVASVADIALLHNKPEVLLEHVTELEALVPSKSWDEAKIIIWSKLHMPDRVLSVCQSAVRRYGDPVHILRMALSMLTHTTYDQLYPAGQRDVGPEEAVLVYPQYLSEGYASAATSLRHRLTDTDTDTAKEASKPLLAMIGLELALAHDDTEWFDDLLDILCGADLEETILGMLNKMSPYINHQSDRSRNVARIAQRCGLGTRRVSDG